jgi:hydroxymethylglutaryl-CoA lyase
VELPASVSIREVGPRDGLQSEPPVPVPGVTYSALVPNRRGAADALAAGADRLQVVVAASESYNRANVNRSVAGTMDEIAGVVMLAGRTPVEATVSTAWGCPYEGEVPRERVVALAERLAGMGCAGVSLGDTTGMATPTRVEALLAALDGKAPALNCHFHDTRGTGLANLLTALQAGCADFDSAVGGLGGSPSAPVPARHSEQAPAGNVASEDVVHMLEDMGVATGVDLDALLAAAQLAAGLVDHPLRSRVLAAGPRTRLLAEREVSG